jgi:hypothetical protein
MASPGSSADPSPATARAPSPVVVWILAVLSFAVFYSTETLNGETSRRIVVPLGVVFGGACFWLLRRASRSARARGESLPTSLRVAGVVAAVGVATVVAQTALLSDWDATADRAKPAARPAPRSEAEVTVADACQLLTAAEAEQFLGTPVTQDGPDNTALEFEGGEPSIGTSRCIYEDPSAPSHQIAIFTSRSSDVDRQRTAKDITDDCDGGERIDGIGSVAFLFDPACTTSTLATREIIIANRRDYISVAFGDQTTVEQGEAIAQLVVSRDTSSQATAP